MLLTLGRLQGADDVGRLTLGGCSPVGVTGYIACQSSMAADCYESSGVKELSWVR